MGTILLILALVVSPWAVARWSQRRAMAVDAGVLRVRALQGLGIAFFYFALGHFVKTQEMVLMLPAWVPERTALVIATGGLELVIGAALLSRRWQMLGAVAAAAALVAFFPANVYAALNHTGMGLHQSGPAYLWIRAPLQLFLLGWALGFGLGLGLQPSRWAQALRLTAPAN